jgi:AAA+ superfamily predicted ATPase
LDSLINLSGADVERIVRRSIKRMILRNQEFLTVKDIKKSLEREKQRALG